MIAGKTVEKPHMYDLQQSMRAFMRGELNKTKVGIVQSYNRTRQTVVVQLVCKLTNADGTVLTVYPLVDVPVFTLQGGGKGFQAPITEGDECVVFFADHDLDTWFQNGGQSVPNSQRVHDLGDGIAFVGLNSLAKPINLTLLAAEVGFGDEQAKVAINNGLITLANNTTTLLILLNNLITILEALTVQDDEGGAVLPLTAASIAALTAYKTTLTGLLY